MCLAAAVAAEAGGSGRHIPAAAATGCNGCAASSYRM
jgi:hypothetical protein